MGRGGLTNGTKEDEEDISEPARVLKEIARTGRAARSSRGRNRSQADDGRLGSFGRRCGSPAG